MGEVVYSASVLNALGYPILVVVFMTVLGLFGLGSGILKRKDKTLSRVAMGCAGLLLCIVAAVMAFLTVRSYLGGAETVTVHLNKKRVVTENCDSGNGTCTRYVLETQSGQIFYDVAVGEDAFNSVEEDSCYRLTYYPNDGLFGPAETTELYQSIGGVTQITTAECP